MRLVIDTSVLVAIYKPEPEADSLLTALSETETAILPGSCLVEAALIRRLGDKFFPWVQKFVDDSSFEIGEISRPIALLAANAARVYGKGSGHRAHLNFGDCLSYAVAKYHDLPLLFVGDDFSKTDIAAALHREP